MDFRVIGFGFGSRKFGEHMLIGSVDFGAGNRVNRAEVALKGFDSHDDGEDHELLQHKILTSIDHIAGSRVFVKVRYLLRDSSGSIDDAYSGGVHVLVFADVSPRPTGPILVGARKGTARTTKGKKARR
jgi:hypothetical protein